MFGYAYYNRSTNLIVIGNLPQIIPNFLHGPRQCSGNALALVAFVLHARLALLANHRLAGDAIQREGFVRVLLAGHWTIQSKTD